MTPLFGRGNNYFTFDGDSQLATAGDSGLINGLKWALAKLTDVKVTCPLASCALGVANSDLPSLMDLRGANTLYPAGTVQRFLAKRPGVALIQTGVNDFINSAAEPPYHNGHAWGGTTPTSPDTVKSTAVILGALATVGDYAGLPVWIVPQPLAYASGTSVGYCYNYECGVANNKVVTAALHAYESTPASDLADFSALLMAGVSDQLPNNGKCMRLDDRATMDTCFASSSTGERSVVVKSADRAMYVRDLVCSMTAGTNVETNDTLTFQLVEGAANGGGSATAVGSPVTFTAPGAGFTATDVRRVAINSYVSGGVTAVAVKATYTDADSGAEVITFNAQCTIRGAM